MRVGVLRESWFARLGREVMPGFRGDLYYIGMPVPEDGTPDDDEEFCACGHPSSEHKHADQCRFEDCLCQSYDPIETEDVRDWGIYNTTRDSEEE